MDEILPQQTGQPFEAAAPGNVLQVMAAQDQHAGLAIDLAQHGLGCDHVLQPVGNIACLAARHLRSPWLVDGVTIYVQPASSILIKIINMADDEPHRLPAG